MHKPSIGKKIISCEYSGVQFYALFMSLEKINFKCIVKLFFQQFSLESIESHNFFSSFDSDRILI